MSGIVVATDLSERGDRAMARAFHLAREREVQLTILTVVDDDLPREMQAELRAAAERRLKSQAATLAGAEGTAYRLEVLAGDPAPAIATVVESDAAELLILGIHRQRAFADAIRDTTMKRILRQIGCPVLVTVAPVAGPYRGILAAVDFSSASAAALRAAVRIAPEAPITAVHALLVPFRGFLPGDPAAPFLNEAHATEKVWRAAQNLPERLGAIEIEEGAPIEVMNRALAASEADLVAVGAHSRSGLVRRLLGSFASAMLTTPTTDVIVARAD